MLKQSIYEKKTKTNGFLKKLPDPKIIQNGLRKFGSFMAGMIMPVIGLIIAWGFMTAILLGIKSALYPANADHPPDFDLDKAFSEKVFYMDKIIGFGISSVIPLLISYMGGRQIYQRKGAIIGVTATIGVMMGVYNPLFNQIMVDITGDQALLTSPPPAMILGAMITGPTAAFIFMKFEKLWIDRIPAGFEMLINNFSIGLIGLVLMAAAFWSIALLAAILQAIFFLIINGINNTGTLFLLPIFVEIEKVLFLNNAVNHGILGPLGYDEVNRIGESAYFFLDPNPGTGMGLLLAYYLFGNKQNKAQSLTAMPIHFIGGIHEVYYPFVLTKPINLLSMIAGGMFASGMYQAFQVGGLFTPSPGSVIMNYTAINPAQAENYIGLTVAIFGSMAISCSLTSMMLIFERIKRNERIYFNPLVAIKMWKVNNLINQKSAFEINKNKPIASISYITKKTTQIDEWEIIHYKNGFFEEFINVNKKYKIIKFKYVIQTNKKGIAHKWLIKAFANGKIKKTKVTPNELIISQIKYEKRPFIIKKRKITFQKVKTEKGKSFTPKPLIQNVWFKSKEENLNDLKEIKKQNNFNPNNENHQTIIKNCKQIIFACEAGMGSSAMGAGIVRKLLKDQKIENVSVVNYAIKDLPKDAKVIITQKIFNDIVKSNFPKAYVYLIDQFLNIKEYEKLINDFENIKGKNNVN